MLLSDCWFTNALGGLVDWTYSGVAGGFQSPTVAGAVDGKSYLYRAQTFDGTAWEVGTGAYTAASKKFARTTVLFNSAGTTAKINFPTPPHVVIRDVGDVFTGNTTIGGALTVAGGLGVVGAANIGGAASAAGFISTQLLGAGPTLSAAGSNTAVVSGGSNIILSFECLVLIRENTSTGAWALFVANGGAITIIAQSAASYVATTTPAAGKYGIGFDGTSYRVYNGAAITQAFSAVVLRTV